jgi:hypothetical protein
MTSSMERWLHDFLTQHHSCAGTIHLFEGDGLRLVAAINIPVQVRQAIEWVPKGKGMAGLALERQEPVQTCNLKADRSGNFTPEQRR